MNLRKTSIIVIILLVGYSIGYFSHIFLYKNITTVSTIQPLQSKKVEEVYAYLEKYYYEFNKKTVIEKEDALIDALTQSLGDKHTIYFNPKDSKEFTESLAGDFEGIGAVIQEHPKGIQIMKVLDNSPAKKNNLIKGDIITQIDNTKTIGMSSNDAVDIIRGPKGTTVQLTVSSGDRERIVDIQRDRVIVPSVYSEVLSGTTIGYIEIGFFGENTTKEFVKAFESVEGSGATAIIIDGRNNGGGYLDSAVNIVSAFIPNNNLVVATRGIRESENMDYISEKQKFQDTDIPVIMIVNNMSASATEILAGALQDYDRAIIVGQKTYGKGSVQEPFFLSDGSMIKITIAKWFTPKDRGIDEKGIEPDIFIELTDDDYKNTYDRQLEGAKIIIENFVNKNISVVDYKKEQESINQLLKENKIYE